MDAATQSVTRLSSLFQRSSTTATVPDAEATECAADVLERERVQTLDRARQQGHAEGMQAAQDEIRAAVEAARRECEAAHAKALEEAEQARNRLSALLRRLPGMIDAIEDGALESSAELAYAALVRVLGEAPELERIRSVCRQALREQSQRPVVVRVCPDDVEAVAPLADAGVRVEGDVRLESGQCQLDTALGTYDTGLDVRLDQLRQAFLRGIATARNLP
ncbi:MAG TPA: FliH/SctL family protein [Lysobacter sp.]